MREKSQQAEQAERIPLGLEDLSPKQRGIIEQYAGVPLTDLTIPSIIDLSQSYPFKNILVCSPDGGAKIKQALYETAQNMIEAARRAGSDMRYLDPDDARRELDNMARLFQIDRSSDDDYPF